MHWSCFYIWVVCRSYPHLISTCRVTVWHHKACWVMPNSDPEGQILSTPNSHERFFFCTSFLFSLLLITFNEVKVSMYWYKGLYFAVAVIQIPLITPELSQRWFLLQHTCEPSLMIDHQGGSLKWTLRFHLKHTTFYQYFEISLIWIKNFLIYSIHFYKTSLKWTENLPDALLKLITCMLWRGLSESVQIHLFRRCLTARLILRSSGTIEIQTSTFLRKQEDAENLVLPGTEQFCPWILSALRVGEIAWVG